MKRHARYLLLGLLSLIMTLGLFPLAAHATDVTIDSTNFPDANFRAAVEAYDTDTNGVLSDEERAAVTEMSLNGLNLDDDKQLQSLEGVEYFTELTKLNVSHNKLTSLDVSALTKLQTLYCWDNKLASLDVTMLSNLKELRANNNELTTAGFKYAGLTNLETLFCYNNQLDAVDISTLTKLNWFECENNALTELNLEGPTELKDLRCFNNQLTSLDLSKQPHIGRLECGSNAFSTLDLSTLYRLNTLSISNVPTLTDINLSNNPELIVLTISKTGISSLDLSNQNKLRDFTCNNNPNIEAIDLSNKTTLRTIHCSENAKLSELNISGDTTLTTLNCEDNQLTELDLTGMTDLLTVRVRNNQLTSLDVSASDKISQLWCDNNKLSYLNIPNHKFYYSTEPLCSDNVYDVVLSADNTLDLTTLPGGGFDSSRVSSLTNATISGNILTVDEGATQVTYSYNVIPSENRTRSFKLIVHQPTGTKYDLTVNGSYASTTGAGNYLNTTKVTIDAGTRSGYTFNGWTSDSSDVVFADASQASTTLTMPAADVTVTASWKEIVEYTLTVNGSYASDSGAGKYSDSTLVTIDAGIRSGYIFDGWTSDSSDVVFADASQASTTITMPAADVTITANWKEITYDLTVNGSYADVTGAGSYTDSTVVTIDAGTRSGYTFNGWTSDSTDVVFADASQASTTITMPAADATITANWKKNASGGGGGSVIMPSYAINVADSTNGSISADRSTALADVLVTLTATPDDGYALDTVTVTDSKNQNVAVNVSANKATFSMPASAVSVTATFKASDVTPTPEPGNDKPFSDVSKSDWFYDDTMYVYENGLMSGTGEKIFSPQMTTTRGMIVTVLYRMEGEPTVSGANPFTDVAAGSYYEDAITWAAANNIVAGYGNGLYGPNDNITREQMAAILYRYANFKGYDVSIGENTNILSYDDATSISDYAFPALQWACGEGLISGMGDGTLAPQANATRAQVAAIFHRFCENVAK